MSTLRNGLGWLGDKGVKQYQHFVPQFYLRGFFDPIEEEKGQHILWLYTVGYKPKRMPTKRIGGEDSLYNFTNDDGIEQAWLEERLGDLERIAAPVLTKLGSADIFLSRRERDEFAGFLALMLCRGRYFFDLANSLQADMIVAQAEDFLADPMRFREAIRQRETRTGDPVASEYDAMEEFLRRLVAGEYIVEDANRLWPIKHMHTQALRLMPLFERMRWILLRSADEMFLTSDNPVNLNDPGLQEENDHFVHSADANFTFPVNRNTLLQGVLTTGSDRIVSIRSYDVRQLNQRTIVRSYQHLYAPLKSERIRLLMERIFRERRPMIPTLIDEFRLSDMPEKNQTNQH